MNNDPVTLRDMAAGPTFGRIQEDRKRASDVLKPVLEAIETRLFDPTLEAEALWQKCSVKKATGTARFAEELDATPYTYLTDRRIEVGTELVAGTNLKIYRISRLLGFSGNGDAFAKAFKTRHETTPSQYRRAHGRSVKQTSSRLARTRQVAQLIAGVDEAAAKGDVAGARRDLCRADGLLLEQEVQERAGRLALAIHQRGAARSREGDVDRAYDDLALARSCYHAAGELASKTLGQRLRIAVSHDTDEALLSKMCPECRERLASDTGLTVRQHLRRALWLVPRDLPWFEASCGECYRLVWDAISRARLGLMDDAWKAWWLSTHVDPRDREAPPSRGRIIAALAEVQGGVFGDQLQRKEYCDMAVEDAVALGDSVLETESRIWLGGALRGMGQFAEAREELNGTAESSRATPWLSALHSRMLGVLEDELNNSQEALKLLGSAAELYGSLDPHLEGLVLAHQGTVHFSMAHYEETIAFHERALSVLDDKRDPLPQSSWVPLNLSASFALLERFDRAEEELSKCRFDRKKHRVLAARELLTRACLALLEERPLAATGDFADVQERFEKLHLPTYAALAASYSVEAYAKVGNREKAIENAAAALDFFEAAGCTRNSIEALGQLRGLLDGEVVDVSTVTNIVRSVGRRHGGWLPELVSA